MWFGWGGVPNDYLVIPVLNWTELGQTMTKFNLKLRVYLKFVHLLLLPSAVLRVGLLEYEQESETLFSNMTYDFVRFLSLFYMLTD